MPPVLNIPIDELIQRIADNCSQEEICEILQIDGLELLEAFSDRIIRNLKKFPDVVTELDYGEENGDG